MATRGQQMDTEVVAWVLRDLATRIERGDATAVDFAKRKLSTLNPRTACWQISIAYETPEWVVFSTQEMQQTASAWPESERPALEFGTYSTLNTEA